jgi:hypothetical protein
MSDEFSKWQRPAGKPETKKPMEVKWKATHGAISKKGDNPYKAEADRDRKIFLWIMAIGLLAAIMVYVIFFTSGNGKMR